MKEQTTVSGDVVIEVAAPMWAVPDWETLMITLVSCALCAYTFTWVVRAAVKNKPKLSGSWILRAVSAISGGASGYLIAGIPWGIIIGLGSGSLTTAVVATIKSRLTKPTKGDGE